jgi:hypothetical protein
VLNALVGAAIGLLLRHLVRFDERVSSPDLIAPALVFAVIFAMAMGALLFAANALVGRRLGWTRLWYPVAPALVGAAVIANIGLLDLLPLLRT